MKLIGANQNWYRSEPHRAKTDALPTYLERYYTAVGDPNDPRSKEKTGIKLDLPHTLREQAHDANKIKIRRPSYYGNATVTLTYDRGAASVLPTVFARMMRVVKGLREQDP